MARAKRRVKAMPEAGFDGAVLSVADVRLSLARTENRVIRCRPGSFEWRYGRKSVDASLYHAGVHFAALWERAGTASASSPDLGAAGGGDWKGMPDGRLVAMDLIRLARNDIGKWGTCRLVDYCVMGTTVAEMAVKYEADERAMAHTLMMDLRACATHFRFL